jgi:chromosome segregation ATPase
MDPISALGLTCNALELIQIAIKTGTAMKQIYDSPEGLRKKHENLLEESKTLETVVDGLENVRSQMSQTQSPLDTRMQQVAADCASASVAIKKVLDRCKAKEKSLVSAAKSTFQLFLHRSDIEDLQAELDQRFQTLTSLTATKTL